MVTDINQIYCGDHFTMYTNIKSLCCTPGTNIMLCVSYSSVKTTTKHRLLGPITRISDSVDVRWGSEFAFLTHLIFLTGDAGSAGLGTTF